MRKILLAIGIALLAAAPVAYVAAVKAQDTPNPRAYNTSGYRFMIVGYGGVLTASVVYGNTTDCNTDRSASLSGTGAGYTHTSCVAVGYE